MGKLTNQFEKLYTLNEVVREAISRYQLELPDYDTDGKNDNDENFIPEIYRKKIQAFASSIHNEEGISLKDAASKRRPKDSANRREQYFYTYDEKEEILTLKEARKYFIDHTTSKEIKAENERLLYLEEELEKEKERYANEMTEIYGRPDIPFDKYTLSTDEEDQEDFQIMLQALFELFYTPLNHALLNHDRYNCTAVGGELETTSSVESKIRHRDFHNYYSPRKEPSKALEPLLNALADKIADKILEKTKTNESIFKNAKK